jgi:hypothetical protein
VPSRNIIIKREDGESNFPLLDTIRIEHNRKVVDGNKADKTFARLEQKIRHDWEGFFAAAYSPDGSILVGGAPGELLICNRRSGKIRSIRVPVKYFFTLAISSDSKAAAWIGVVDSRKDEGESDYSWYPDPDAVGTINLDTGRTTIRRVRWIKQMPKGFSVDPSRISISRKREILYFLIAENRKFDSNSQPIQRHLARFDIKRGTIKVIAKDVQSFAVPY